MNIEKILTKTNKALIISIAKKFYGEVYEDLYQAGVLGLLKAYKNYEKEATCKFSSYAYKYIYGEMYQLVNNKNIKVNRNLLKLHKMIEKTRETLTQKYNRQITNKDIADFLNLSEREINEAVASCVEIISLEGENGTMVYDTKNYASMPNTDNKILIDEGMEILSPAEAQIIKARYYEDLTQSETAKKLSMTQVMVSRYEKQSLNKMYAFMQR